ncbi:alpha-1,2-mannosidase [Xanthomonas fragariae]|uniref:Alpha-1,2-mannosidase n=1 Tax=Xanthomonas fragariae TaxID=48664 RepID=A0A1Y6HEU9_9XANT|nr:hypothetical protein BER92_03245 [Xanthomonas fragariae]ENZ96238.1 alpha-1,2-mannosidase [Xanthomonas fragariae LMG 25863]AOD17305.1 hypothetical protein BER93_03245 [Xanthomonas fragariae]SMQ96650.1 alpha-1,2-mannosidase [Xanthomonas fragariae]SMR00553.1 hypothetical protein PD885_03332 [Xanthomonas fragariae]
MCTLEYVTGKRSAPLQDLLGEGARIAPADGGDVAALHDDDAGTVAAEPSAFAPTLKGLEHGAATLYAYTHGNAAIAASGWTLEARAAGGAWKVVDQRREKAFEWPLQTRPFRIATPSVYAAYRLRLNAPEKVQLAQIELLGVAAATR